MDKKYFKFAQTAERVSHQELSDNFVYQRSLLAYLEAAKIISGNVLELGTGSGYAIRELAKKSNRVITVDKYKNKFMDCLEFKLGNVNFVQMEFPPLHGIPDNYFDYVISFQVIEHVEDDSEFVKEINRVLKINGKLIVSTPNKKMSLTRNPWHVREYTIDELNTLLTKSFSNIEKYGVFGNQKIDTYYTKNKAAVEKIKRFDFFNLQYKLPRKLLQIPYDILNRINRKLILKSNKQLVLDIQPNDYYLEAATDHCFDLFYIAEKT